MPYSERLRNYHMEKAELELKALPVDKYEEELQKLVDKWEV